MNTQHTEPPSWLFTSYNTLRQQVHLSYSSIRNTRPDTRSFSRTAEDTTLMRKACFVLFFEGTHELKWLKYRKWLPCRTPLFSVHDCLCGWDHYPLCHSATPPVRVLAWAWVAYIRAKRYLSSLWVHGCVRVMKLTERQPDSLAERPRFEPDLFLFFFPRLSRSLSCHMVKVEPVAGNDKQATRGGWGWEREGEGWVDGWMEVGTQGGGGGRERHKGEPVTLT